MRTPHRIRLWIAAMGLAFSSAAVLPWDLQIARALQPQSDILRGDMRRVLDLCETFAHGAGVVMILLTAWVLDPSSRRCLPRIATASLGGGLAADLIKLLIARTRPHAFEFTGDVWTTFAGWLPMLPGEPLFDSALQSFPSSHAATGVGLAIGLAWRYPRGAWLFGVFAVLACLQRISAAAHFPSDVLAGAAMGWLFGAACTGKTGLGKLFARFESRSSRA